MSKTAQELLAEAPHMFDEEFGSIVQSMGHFSPLLKPLFYQQYLSGVEYKISYPEAERIMVEAEAAIQYALWEDSFAVWGSPLKGQAARCCSFLFFLGWSWASTELD